MVLVYVRGAGGWTYRFLRIIESFTPDTQSSSQRTMALGSRWSSGYRRGINTALKRTISLVFGGREVSYEKER